MQRKSGQGNDCTILSLFVLLILADGMRMESAGEKTGLNLGGWNPQGKRRD